GQVGRHPPDHRAVGGVQAEHLRRLEPPAQAAAEINPSAGHAWAAVNVPGATERPADRAGRGVEAVNAVVAGAEEHRPVGDARAGLDVAGRLEVPQLLPGGGVEAAEL